MSYDLWLVNGNPVADNHNPFKYQYSCDTQVSQWWFYYAKALNSQKIISSFPQDLFPVYLWLLCIYSVLLPLQFYAHARQRHPVARLLLCALASEFTALLLTNAHHALFATNGVGVPFISTVGDIVEIFSQVGKLNQLGKCFC